MSGEGVVGPSGIAPLAFRPCALVPVFNNAATLRRVVESVRQFIPDILVIDDGSGPETRSLVEALAEEGLVSALLRARNGGKGAAVKDGFRHARDRGFTHAFQVDADGQHDLTRVEEFLRVAAGQPETLLLAYPLFDQSAPASRVRGRVITNLWVAWEAGRGVIRDAMVGFRVYPLASALAVTRTGDRMEFDIEIAVRMAWAGIPILNLPVQVRYLSTEEGGVSSFRPVSDNLRIAWLHTRLSCRALGLRLRRAASLRT